MLRIRGLGLGVWTWDFGFGAFGVSWIVEGNSGVQEIAPDSAGGRYFLGLRSRGLRVEGSLAWVGFGVGFRGWVFGVALGFRAAGTATV